MKIHIIDTLSFFFFYLRWVVTTMAHTRSTAAAFEVGYGEDGSDIGLLNRHMRGSINYSNTASSPKEDEWYVLKYPSALYLLLAIGMRTPGSTG